MTEFISLIGVAYFMSAGTGALIARGRGVRFVNRWWARAATRPIVWVLNATGDLLKQVARKIRF